MFDDNTVAARAARGAALLDEKILGWAERIDVDRLRIDDPFSCILGQLFSGNFLPYTHGVEQVFGYQVGLDTAVDFGFEDFYSDDLLTNAWLEEISARTGR